MPLEHSASDEARQHNIEEMIHSGHDPKQAVAASYENQRRVAAGKSLADRLNEEGKNMMDHVMAHAAGAEGETK